MIRLPAGMSVRAAAQIAQALREDGRDLAAAEVIREYGALRYEAVALGTDPRAAVESELESEAVERCRRLRPDARDVRIWVWQRWRLGDLEHTEGPFEPRRRSP